ncbi:SCO family protein [Pigmentibacter sp. JX0631]|uniref:SCO family protein n=1 Tax=Pigmentibacter sp. JX0631 TaxID=2976982 RepID=UPI002469B000|nr:SCO family protein [Pigmentibacter sp. JX0631]WGL60698.1 SCO family protein [Pigmentibacter sp. JX0631]
MAQKKYLQQKRKSIIYLVLLGIILIAFHHRSYAETIKQEKQGEIYEKLNTKVDLSLKFKNQLGNIVSLNDLLQNEKVLIITLNYYKCTTMCALQFVNLADSLKKLGWKIGDGFRIATVSFDPKDNVDIAAEKHKVWVPKTGQESAKWDFLVADEESIKKLTKQLNFYYEYEPRTGEYSHAAALFFIKKDGTFYRYLYGIVYEPKEIKQAIIETSSGELGSFIEKIMTKFSKYKEQNGKYVSILSNQ